MWITDDDEFEHIFKNSQRTLKLNTQYENHPYDEEFEKECSVIFIHETYVLEGKVDIKFSLGEVWNLLQAPNNASKFCKQMINCMEAWNYIQKTSGSPLSIETIKKTHKIMMDNEKRHDVKDVLMGEFRKSSVFAGYHFFAPADLIERYMKVQFLGFMKLKRMIQL